MDTAGRRSPLPDPRGRLPLTLLGLLTVAGIAVAVWLRDWSDVLQWLTPIVSIALFFLVVGILKVRRGDNDSLGQGRRFHIDAELADRLEAAANQFSKSKLPPHRSCGMTGGGRLTYYAE
jgi:hypothetical protein